MQKLEQSDDLAMCDIIIRCREHQVLTPMPYQQTQPAGTPISNPQDTLAREKVSEGVN